MSAIVRFANMVCILGAASMGFFAHYFGDIYAIVPFTACCVGVVCILWAGDNLLRD